MNLLPDSRSKKGAIRGPDGRYWVPVYCANCKSGAHTLVPEEGMTFAFWLCQKCEKGWGGLAAIYAVPDEVFFQNLKEAQIERYGRELEPEELISV